MPVKVFGSLGSAEVARVLACLFEKDVEFQLIRVDSFRGVQRLPQHLKLQPHGEALAFEDGSVIHVESRKVMRHAADKYKEQGFKDLFGSGALERASVEQWLQTEAANFDVPSAEMVFSLARQLPRDVPLDGSWRPPAPAPGMHPAHRRQAEELQEAMQRYERRSRELGRLLDMYDQRLGEQAYLATDNFTLADLSHLPNADRLAADPRSAHLIESRRNVRRWWRDISGRASWRRVRELQRPPPSAEAPF
ncbi:hypothetical protein ACP4OV_004057 [Aristida adscensionis]